MSQTRVLHILSSLNYGGIESMLYNYYSHIDREKILFDFIVYSDKVGGMEADFMKLGSSVFHVTPKRVSLSKSNREIKNVIKNGKYDCVHVHQGLSSFNSLMLAKRFRTPLRVVHAHGANSINSASLIGKMSTPILRFLNRRYSDWRFACSDEAGENMCGTRRWARGKSCLVMKNAFDLSGYLYSEEHRERIRSELGVSKDTFFVMHAGRMSKEKNQGFLIRAFAEFLKKKSDSILVLAGGGTMRAELEETAASLGISDKVRFVGVIKNLNEWYSAADLFVLPSLYEGLGMVAIEAQVSGVPMICSSGVPLSAIICEGTERIPLDSGETAWAEKMLHFVGAPRVFGADAARAAGYDIDFAAKKYEDWLLKHTER